jgi:hypothetical protein
MLKCIWKKIPKYVIKKYFQIVIKLFLCNFSTLVTKGLKSLYAFLNNYIDFKFLWYSHNVFIIKFYKILFYLLLLLFLQSKVQKIKKWLRLRLVHVSLSTPNEYIHHKLTKLHRFVQISWYGEYEWYLYIFNILNIQINKTLKKYYVHECSCLKHKNCIIYPKITSQ